MIKFHCFIFIIIIFSINNVYASAWLLEKGRYRYIVSGNNVNKQSRHEKKRREEATLYIREKLLRLYERMAGLDKNSSDYKQLSKQIKRLEQTNLALTAYQDEQFKTIYIEYGVNDNQNIGANFLYKEDRFLGKRSSTKEAGLYYKFKLFADQDFVISLQPKIFVNKNSCRFARQEFFAEVSLLSGISKNIRSLSIFNQNTFSFGHYLNYTGNKKKYYTFSTTEGIKFNNGIMLSSFTKYHTRQNYSYVYDSSVYEQLGVAKVTNIDQAGGNTVTTQIGYFWDQSLSNKKYKMSGITFAIWLDV